MKNYSLLLCATVTLLALTGCPETKPVEGIPGLTDHLKRVENATFDEFSKIDDAKVKDSVEFERMKRHILDHYTGVEVVNSFELDPGVIVDCIKRETQPSLNTPDMKGHRIVAPPKHSEEARLETLDQENEGVPVDPQLSKNKYDRFQNVRYCEEGTIPMRRLMLENLVRFKTLDDVFSKYGVAGTRQNPNDSSTSAVDSHYWAHAEQTVDNHGGDSRLNVWRPDPKPGVFALSQHWYVSGTGANRQTCEGGWQVYKRLYDNSDPNLFIYYTNKNYENGSGCYNLDCAGFIQINNTWVLGGKLAPVSTSGGTQYIIRMQWQLFEGNWWLFVKGAGDYIPVGYYPGSVYKGGLMSRLAQSIDYGGEVAAQGDKTTTGQMGSGAFADKGWEKSCYQRTIYYIDLNQTSQWANLTAYQNTPNCYTIDLHNMTRSSWATYLYFGGPKCPNP
jgi:hypothetical protein